MRIHCIGTYNSIALTHRNVTIVHLLNASVHKNTGKVYKDVDQYRSYIAIPDCIIIYIYIEGYLKKN